MQDDALVALALGSGIRQGELAALRWEDLDLDGPRPSVRVSRSADTRTQTLVTSTKTGEEQVVRLGPRTVEGLEAHSGRQRKERIAATTWEDPDWVLSNTKGKVRRRNSVMRSFRSASVRAMEEAF